MATPTQLDAAQRMMRLFSILEGNVVKVVGPLHMLTERRMDLALHSMADGEFGGVHLHPVTVVLKQAELVWGEGWRARLQEYVLSVFPDYEHDTPLGLDRRQAAKIAVELDWNMERDANEEKQKNGGTLGALDRPQ